MDKKTKLTNRIKKYFLDFLMLFLAVFMGFYAENLRDKHADKTKEKEYIKSMIEDVKADKKNLQVAIINNEHRKIHLDTLSQLCFDYNIENNEAIKLYKKYPAVLNRPDFFHPIEFTMQQLKNAGGMRLIQNKKAVKAILSYDFKHKKVKNQQKYYENYQNNTINLGLNIFNYQKTRELFLLYQKRGVEEIQTSDFKLLNNSTSDLTKFGNTVSMYSGIVNYYTILLKDMDKQADSLLITLLKEYELKE